jgi:hypothetical protein
MHIRRFQRRIAEYPAIGVTGMAVLKIVRIGEDFNAEAI